LGAIHALAACAPFVALPMMPALLVAIGVALSAAVHIGRALQWRRDAVRELRLRPDGGVAWRVGDGTWHAAADVTGGVLAPWMIVVGLKEVGRRRRPLLVLPDALDGDGFRELRLWLRWRPQLPRRPGIGVI